MLILMPARPNQCKRIPNYAKRIWFSQKNLWGKAFKMSVLGQISRPALGVRKVESSNLSTPTIFYIRQSSPQGLFADSQKRVVPNRKVREDQRNEAKPSERTVFMSEIGLSHTERCGTTRRRSSISTESDWFSTSPSLARECRVRRGRTEKWGAYCWNIKSNRPHFTCRSN